MYVNRDSFTTFLGSVEFVSKNDFELVNIDIVIKKFHACVAIKSLKYHRIDQEQR